MKILNRSQTNKLTYQKPQDINVLVCPYFSSSNCPSPVSTNTDIHWNIWMFLHHPGLIYFILSLWDFSFTNHFRPSGPQRGHSSRAPLSMGLANLWFNNKMAACHLIWRPLNIQVFFFFWEIVTNINFKKEENSCFQKYSMMCLLFQFDRSFTWMLRGVFCEQYECC